MHTPQSIPLYNRYAEVMYTMGGVHLKTARQYYAAALKLSNGQDLRALYGTCCTAAALAGQKVGQADLQQSFLPINAESHSCLFMTSSDNQACQISRSWTHLLDFVVAFYC